MSWLPVPRSPATFHVSTMRASVAGKSIMRACGAPVPRTRQPPMSHAQCSLPDANGQRPATRYPSCSGTAVPRGAKTPPVTIRGSAP